MRFIYSLIALLSVYLMSMTHAQGQIIRTIAGTGGTLYIGDGGPALSAQMGLPHGVAVDRRGNVFFSDPYFNVVRKIAVDGIITTVVGRGYPGYAGDGGPATAALLSSPFGMDFDAYGNLYIADGGNYVIRKLDTNGIITTAVGTNVFGSRGDGGPATNARIGAFSVSFDNAGNMYITDGTSRVRKVNTSGIISTVIGNGTVGYGGNGGQATAATLDGTGAVAVDSRGNMYVTDKNNENIRKINPSGIITHFAGVAGTPGLTGDGSMATNARLNAPTGLKIDANGFVYVADQGNHRIRRIDTNGIITTVVGTTGGFGGDGGPATAAKIQFAPDFCFDQYRNMYIADRGGSYFTTAGHRIRQVFRQDSLNITVAPDTNICIGDSLRFTAVSRYPVMGVVYEWKRNGTIVGTNSPTFSSSTWTNGDRITCSLVDTVIGATYAVSNAIRVTVRTPVVPTLNVTSTGDTFCFGQTVTLSATSTNGGATPKYYWKVFSRLIDSGATFTYIPNNGDVINCVFVSSAFCASPDTVISSRGMFVYPSIRPDIIIRAIHGDSATYPGEYISLFSSVTYGGTRPTYQWYMNNRPIPGATTDFYKRRNYSIDTFYVVMYSNEFCVVPAMDTSNYIVMKISKVSVSDLVHGNAKIAVYPNPSKGAFSLSIANPDVNFSQIHVAIRNTVGTLVYQKDGFEAGENVEISVPEDLPSGIYYLMYHDDTHMATLPIMIEK